MKLGRVYPSLFSFKSLLLLLIYLKGLIMADKKGFGMKTSSINNYYKLLADAKPNFQDLQTSPSKSVTGKRNIKKSKG